MTQRTKYRTGRRSANRHADKSGKHVSAKSVSMQEETQPKELIMMNEKNESQELEQIETKKIENTSPAPEQVEGVEVVEVAEVKSTLDTSEEMLSERVEEVSQHEASTVASEDASTTTNVSEESVSAHSSRGGVGKMILGGVIVASLAGGAYYYAQQNQLFGLGESSTTESTLTEAPQSSDTSVVNTAENTVATTDTNEKTEMTAETNSAETTSAETTSAESSSVADTLAKELSDNAKKTEETAKALADDLIGTGVTEEKVETSDTEEKTPESPSEAMTSETIQQDPSSVVASSITENTTNSVSPESAESNSATQALEARLAAQEQQIAQLVAQLKEAQAVAAEQQAKEQKQQSLRHVLNELSGLYQAADFERTVRVNKENAVKALGILKNQLALQTDEVWNGVRQAVDSDIEALNNAGDINLDKLFAASNELAELVKSAPFVSAESGNDTVATTANTVTDTTSNTGGSWLDQAINHVERLPAQAYEAIRSDLGGLVKVEKLSNPAVAMMSISDIQAQRAETLRQLSIAQEALLKRQEPVWKAAMQKVEQQLMTYYNLNIEKTQQAVALARQLMNTSVQSSLPALSNTQQALEQFARQLRIEN
ncbi:uroporphyrinogen-III C-methyltransferase [Pelistega suis]|uniref:HemX protein n=1 Tax=Pelistega suis TaxID=1631957 RepID=A0A849P1L3_9BURK|nr:uroporphyrinogen-III C-methyltransferase [Pelistega suis]NOL51300.1 hypothetical protein [Pelistega suis]